MTTENNKAFIRRYLEIFSGKDKPATQLKEYITEAGEGLIEHILAFEAAFPRYQLAIDDIFAEEDKVAVRFTFKGVHKGDLMGIPPTDREVTFPGIVIYHLADGKIDESWLSINQLDMMPGR